LRWRKFDETRPVAPRNARAVRRVDAERTLRGWANGVMAAYRFCVSPAFMQQTACRWNAYNAVHRRCCLQEDVYTNHIHADDLARLLLSAIVVRASAARVSRGDDSDMPDGRLFRSSGKCIWPDAARHACPAQNWRSK
jgi:hypothetical protein